MFKENRLQFAIFFIFILAGSWFILDKAIPEFHVFAVKYTQWPEILILLGGGIFIFGILLGESDMFVPATVIMGVGKILSYQGTHDGLTSWSYMWTLLPGFVGAGMVVAGLFDEESRQYIRLGFILTGVSAVLFLILSTFLGGWNWIGG